MLSAPVDTKNLLNNWLNCKYSMEHFLGIWEFAYFVIKLILTLTKYKIGKVNYFVSTKLDIINASAAIFYIIFFVSGFTMCCGYCVCVQTFRLWWVSFFRWLSFSYLVSASFHFSAGFHFLCLVSLHWDVDFPKCIVPFLLEAC